MDEEILEICCYECYQFVIFVQLELWRLCNKDFERKCYGLNDVGIIEIVLEYNYVCNNFKVGQMLNSLQKLKWRLKYGFIVVKRIVINRFKDVIFDIRCIGFCILISMIVKI